MANTWYNGDGLYLKYGTAMQTPQTAGEYRRDGEMRIAELILDLTTVGTASAIVSDTYFFPSTMRIEQVEVVTHTAATGSGAVLNIGLTRLDRTTAIDADGLVAALPVTSMDTAGEKTVLNVGSTFAGALIGTATSNAGYLCADYDTAAFTAGVVRIRVRYYGYGTISN